MDPNALESFPQVVRVLLAGIIAAAVVGILLNPVAGIITGLAVICCLFPK